MDGESLEDDRRPKRMPGLALKAAAFGFCAALSVALALNWMAAPDQAAPSGYLPPTNVQAQRGLLRVARPHPLNSGRVMPSTPSSSVTRGESVSRMRLGSPLVSTGDTQETQGQPWPSAGLAAPLLSCLMVGSLAAAVFVRRQKRSPLSTLLRAQAEGFTEPTKTTTAPGPPGTFYFESCVDCRRAWDKPPKRPTDEPWRDPAHRYCDCGEDSFMCSPTVLAVADGVGGWSEVGVDPSLFANKLMQGVKEGVEGRGVMDPIALMTAAFVDTLQQVPAGSATCIIATLEADGALVTANMGDCGLLVIRGDQLVYRTEEMLLAFNTPFQLSTEANTLQLGPEDSEVGRFQTQPGDIVILSSDGLLDNLTDQMIVEIVNDSIGSGGSSLAQRLCQQGVRVSHSTSAQTPFASKALQAGYWYLGGKPDDITVVVGTVRQS